MPIENIVPGSTISVVKKFEDNRNLHKHFSEMPKLLTKTFDLMGAETFQVFPTEKTCRVINDLHTHYEVAINN